MVDLSIIIVNYNVKEFLQNLLNSLIKATANITSEIIVVDNASDDGSVQVIKKRFPKIKLIVNKENVGFGSANNQALKMAEGKFIVLINPDTLVKEDTFKKLLNFFDSTPEAGLAGCKVLNPDGTLQLACRRGFPKPWTSFTKVFGLSRVFPKSKLFARYNLTYLDENETYEVDAISGAFMMMRREVYNKIGGFDTKFFMYGEDLDFCYRTQQAGFKVYYFSETEIIHFKGESTKRSKIDETKLFYDAMHLFVKKHFSSSFLISSILQFVIIFRRIVAFINAYKFVMLAVLLDFTFFVGAVVLAEKIYMSDHWLGFPSNVKPWIFILPAFLQVIISSLAGAYKRNWLSILKSLISLLIGFVILSALTFFFKQYAFSRAVVVLSYAFLIVLYPLWRILFKLIILKNLGGSSRASRTIIVGTGSKAIDIATKLKSDLSRLHNIIGLVALDMQEVGKNINEYKIIGSIDNIKKLILSQKVDQVIFAAPDINFDKMFSVVSLCQGVNVDFLVSGSELDFLVGKSIATNLDNVPLLKMYYNISSPTHKFLKRSLDVTLSILILIFIYPFIYFFDKLNASRNNFREFVLAAPSVLFGKKSFVGPETSSYHNDLYLGKLGLTGFWFTETVSRNDKNEINKLNIFYAKNQNLWLDLEILGKTISKMFHIKEK